MSVLIAKLGGLTCASQVQAEIDAAPEGAIIELPEGRIVGPLKLDRDVVLLGKGPSRTIIDGNGEGATIEVRAEGLRIRIEGVAITGGYAHAGGGVAVHQGAKLTLRKCVVAGNESLTVGGGIALSNATVRLVETIVGDNVAKEGGAIFAGHRANLRVTKGHFTRNEAAEGGAVLIEGRAFCRFDGVNFDCNVASERGHQLVAYGADRGRTPDLEFCRVKFNPVRRRGSTLERRRRGDDVFIDPEYPASIELFDTRWPLEIAGEPAV